MQTFEPTDLKYTYSPEHDPIGTVAPGEPFAVVTRDCFTGRYDDPANFNAETAAWVDEHLNGVTGPIAVEGAEPGEAVEVKIESVQVDTPGHVVVSRCEALSPADWWHEEDHVVNLVVDDGQIVLGEGWTVPVAPLIGCLATAPARETVLSRHEGGYLGNVDCREITGGATVILPVASAGRRPLLRRLQGGDGRRRGRVRARGRGADRRLGAPDQAAGLDGGPAGHHRRPADRRSSRASRSPTRSRAAFRELKLWLEDEWSLSSDQAAIVMGIGAHCGIGQVSNLLHTAKCSIARSLLPRTM